MRNKKEINELREKISKCLEGYDYLTVQEALFCVLGDMIGQFALRIPSSRLNEFFEETLDITKDFLDTIKKDIERIRD